MELDLPNDYFTSRNGVEFAGTHIIIDFWGGTNLHKLDVMETAMRDAILACGATLLHLHLHHFTPQGGITGVAVLAESHISVHTWPERRFAAFDVFMCGTATPEAAIPVFRSAFQPSEVRISELYRGSDSASQKIPRPK